MAASTLLHMTTRERIASAAADHLDADETVLMATWGYTSVLGAWLGTARGRVVIATDRRILVMGSSYWRPGKPVSLLSIHPYGSVQVAADGWSLRIGDHRLVVHLHHLGRVRRVAELSRTAQEVAS